MDCPMDETGDLTPLTMIGKSQVSFSSLNEMKEYDKDHKLPPSHDILMPTSTISFACFQLFMTFLVLKRIQTSLCILDGWGMSDGWFQAIAV